MPAPRHRRPTARGRRFGGLAPLLAPALLALVGLAFLAKPIVEDWVYSWQAERAISELTSVYDDMGDPQRLENLAQAQAWNARLRGEDPGMDLWDYRQQLTYHSTPESMMAYVQVPKIGLRLPIYHGANDEVLSAGVGHCEWSALPVGGKGTRCVLTAHSGLERARMFDDVRLLAEGDAFVVWALGEPHAYQVRDVQVILPEEVGKLAPKPGEDLCSLVTCTPMGVNSHRLVVTGVRCPYVPSAAQEGRAVLPVGYRNMPFLVGAVATAISAAVLLLAYRHHRRERGENK